MKEEEEETTAFDGTLMSRRLQSTASELPCDLECKNGGTCRYVDGTLASWRYTAQSGGLVQTCDCPSGFGGVGCEIPVERCIDTFREQLQQQGGPVVSKPQEDGTWQDNVSSTAAYSGEDGFVCEHSGKACDLLPDGSRTCACHVADAVDPQLAGLFCRRWTTEYCTGQLEVSDTNEIYFCTNGGKCQADFIAAQIAPGDVSVNQEYADAGCVCNEHFYGPHCEFLEFDAAHNVLGQGGHVVPDWKDDRAMSHSGHFGVAAGVTVVATLALFLYRRLRRHTVVYDTALSTPHDTATAFKDQEDQVEFSESTHRDESYNSTPPQQDLYMAAVLGGSSGLEDVNLSDEDDHNQDDYDEGHDPLQAPSVSLLPTLETATALEEQDQHQDLEENNHLMEQDDNTSHHHFT